MPLVSEFRQVDKPQALIEGLGKLWGQDKLVEQKMRRARTAFGICCIVLALSVIIAIPTGNAWALLVSLPIVLFSGLFWWRYSRLNLDDRRILTPIKFLEVMQADIAPKDPVRLMVSFDDYKRHGRKLAETKQGGSSRAKYLDTWLEIEGWLADRTRFRVAVSDRVSLATKRKRKYTKKKERIRELVSIQLRAAEKLDPERAKQVSAQAGDSVADLTLKSARATPRGLVLVAESGWYSKLQGRGGAVENGTEHLVQGDKLLQLMVLAYDRLNRCRAGART